MLYSQSDPTLVLYPKYYKAMSRIKEKKRAEELATQIEGQFPETFLLWFLVLRRISNIWNSAADPKIRSQTWTDLQCPLPVSHLTS